MIIIIGFDTLWKKVLIASVMANFLSIAKPNVTLERLLIGSSFLCVLATLLPNDLLSTFSSLFCKDIYQWMARQKGKKKKSFLGSKRKIWLIFVLNSHTENGMNDEENSLLLYEKYEKMLKWNNVIKKFTIYHHHNPLLLGVLLFLRMLKVPQGTQLLHQKCTESIQSRQTSVLF